MRSILRLLPLIATKRGLFVEAVLWSIVTQASVLLLALGTAWVVGRFVAGLPVELSVIVAILTSLSVLVSVTAWRESWVSHDLAYRLIGALRGHVFDALRRSLPFRTGHRRTGDLVTTAVADIETLEWLYAHTAAQTVSALLVLTISALVSFTISPVLILIWVPLLVIGIAVPLLTARRATHDGDRLARGAASLRAELLDTVRGIRELAGSGALERQLDRLTDETRVLAATQTREASRLGLERGIADVTLALAALGTILVVLVGRVVAPQDIALAVVVSVAGLGPAAQIADLLRNAGTLRASAVRIAEILDHAPAVAPSCRVPSPPRADEEGLVFDGVAFAYDGVRPVLEGFAMRVRPGETVALVGPSGAGKTTIARLALRLWDPDAGSIRIDGVDLRDLPDDSLRRLVSAVPQGSPLLRGTIRSNIALGTPTATEAMIRTAAGAAGLFDPAAGLPGGLGTSVGEHGAGLSGGQRARVAIARALLSDPRVLILDEPTASLDPDADRAVMDFLSRSRDRAVLLIAHRPATVSVASRVVPLAEHSADG